MKKLNHIALILDGNGRWAKKRGLPRAAGHVEGGKNVEYIWKECMKRDIEYLTVYVFSTENWKRPQDEVNALMKLFNTYLDKCIRNTKKDNVAFTIIGDRKGLGDLLPKAEELEKVSRDNTGLHLQIAVNYGSRDEIKRSVKNIAKDYKDGKISEEDITEDLISSYLDTKGIPDPDLMIRTSGELRLSNYLLWQLAYSEFYFTEVPWPDFKAEDLDKAIEAYYARDRRFGDVKEES